MRTRGLRTTVTVAAVLMAATVAACSSAVNDATTPTVPAAAATATAASTPTATATTTAAPDPVPTIVGATILASQVAAVRAAGGHVYISPNGAGDGLVVAAGQPLPQVVVADWKATGAAQVANTSDAETARSKAIDAMLRALVDLNVPVVSVSSQGSFKDGKLIEKFWAVGIDGVPNYYDINKTLGRQQTHASAKSIAQKLSAVRAAAPADQRG